MVHIDQIQDEKALEAMAYSMFKITKQEEAFSHVQMFFKNSHQLFSSFQKQTRDVILVYIILIVKEARKEFDFVQKILSDYETNALLGKKLIDEYLALIESQNKIILQLFDEQAEELEKSFEDLAGKKIPRIFL